MLFTHWQFVKNSSLFYFNDSIPNEQNFVDVYIMFTIQELYDIYDKLKK